MGIVCVKCLKIKHHALREKFHIQQLNSPKASKLNLINSLTCEILSMDTNIFYIILKKLVTSCGGSQPTACKTTD
jgi:hypothetical protein